MVDISGRYDFHRDASAPGMQIVRVDATGQILEGQIGQSPIHGQYDAATNAIAFNDARRPGDTLFVTYYTGYVMLNNQGGVYGMAGTYQELELLPIVPPLPLAEARAGATTAASGLETAAPARTPEFGITTVQGPWYAIWLDEPLV
jgi:hypothetical protein